MELVLKNITRLVGKSKFSNKAKRLNLGDLFSLGRG